MCLLKNDGTCQTQREFEPSGALDDVERVDRKKVHGGEESCLRRGGQPQRTLGACACGEDA